MPSASESRSRGGHSIPYCLASPYRSSSGPTAVVVLGDLEARGLLRPGTFVIATTWISAGKIAAALHDSVPVIVAGNPKQFACRYDPRESLGRDAIVIGPADSMSSIVAGLRPWEPAWCR
jgi:hypothetical protein